MLRWFIVSLLLDSSKNEIYSKEKCRFRFLGNRYYFAIYSLFFINSIWEVDLTLRQN